MTLAEKIRTGWITMPAKGNIITMDLGNGTQQYRVLNTNRYNAEVLVMYDVGEVKFGNDNEYANSKLDAYLNEIWHNTLSTEARDAIVPQNIVQDVWCWGDKGTTKYNETYDADNPGYTISTDGDTKPIGNRRVYVLSVQDVVNYVGADNISMESVNTMFFGSGDSVSYYPWLRSADAGDSGRAWCVSCDGGNLRYGYVIYDHAARPALTIDLSKFNDWSIVQQ